VIPAFIDQRAQNTYTVYANSISPNGYILLMPDFHKRLNEAMPQPMNAGGVLLQKKQKNHKLLWLFILLGMVILGFGFGVTAKVIMSVNTTNTETGEKVAFFDQLRHLIVSPEKQLRGESQDRINILLIGIGGEGHQGAYLADTIILASIKPSTGEVAMLSIPRDLYVDIPEYGYRKINNAMAFGHSNNYPGGGEVLLSRVVSEVTGQQIHYFGRIDFGGFEKIVNDLGGIDINVERSFVDYEYPDNNFGYQTARFEKGLRHMDGATALKYVRSRHGSNGEGSDFARSQRQQKVLLAIKQQGLSFDTLTTPKRIIDALEDLGEHNRTDLQIWEILRLAKMADKIQDTSVVTQALDTTPEGLLKSGTTLDGAYILTPRSGNYDEIQELINNAFSRKSLQNEQPQVEIQNGTKTPGLAAEVSREMPADFTITSISNASRQDYKETLVIDLSGGTKPLSLTWLTDHLNADAITNTPGFLINSSSPVTYEDLQGSGAKVTEQPKSASADFLIILGTEEVSRQTPGS